MPADEGPRRVLCIPMPGPRKKDCFIATSFDPALEPISGAIAKAVGSRFHFNRADLNPGGPKWTDTFPEWIRNAAVVVAVINNKAGDKCRINANVAYELGVAHALGKPVIIITDNIQDTRFSDIQHFIWIESHSDGEFRERDFIARLTNHLTALEDRLDQPYSHPFWPGATLQDLDHVRPTNKTRLDLLDSLEDAFRYGKDIHGKFHALNASHLIELSTSTYEAIHSKDVESCAKKVCKEFNKYDRFYREEIGSFLENDEPTLHTDADEAMSRFANNSLAIGLDTVRAYIEDVKRGYNSLKKVYETAVVDRACEDRKQNRKCYSEVKHLQGCCNTVVSEADDYLRALMDAFMAISKEQYHDARVD